MTTKDRKQILIENNQTIPKGRDDARNVINSIERVEKKRKLLKAMEEIKFSYELFYKNSGKKAINLLDGCYKKLETQIDVLESGDEFEMIQTCVNNFRMSNKIEIEHIFKIKRKNEDPTRCDRFKDVPNRKLLWHGTPTTKIPSILKNGLLIDPPDVGATGCALGKGLYFADIVANAIQYCNAEQSNNVGRLLLCEVALGESLSFYGPENIEDLPGGRHSVIGVGKVAPNSNVLMAGGAIIPSGIPVNNQNTPPTYFDYDEFVVQNEEQVQLKYLIQLNINSDY